MIKIILWIAVAVICLYILWKSFSANNKCPKEELQTDGNTEEEYINEVIKQYGEPVEVLRISALTNTRQELPLMLYADFLIINKQRINQEDISDITFNNSANPYIANDYQVIITLQDESKKSFSVGNDIDQARYIMQRLTELYR